MFVLSLLLLLVLFLWVFPLILAATCAHPRSAELGRRMSHRARSTGTPHTS